MEGTFIILIYQSLVYIYEVPLVTTVSCRSEPRREALPGYRMKKAKKKMVVRNHLKAPIVKPPDVHSSPKISYGQNGEPKKTNQLFVPISKNEESEPLYQDSGSFVLSHSPMSKQADYASSAFKCEEVEDPVLMSSFPFVEEIVVTSEPLHNDDHCPAAINKLTLSHPINTSPKKPKKLARKPHPRLKSPATTHRQLTEFYPIRRSCRQTRSRLLKEKQSKFEEFIVAGRDDGIKAVQVIGKGRGVIATRSFKKGECVVEYAGELIGTVEAKRREVLYAKDQNTGCYMYYFIHNNRRYCVDATAESDRLGRLINHSRNGNLITKSFALDGVPHLILVAKQDIAIGEELLYDYGDRSKASLESHPWLAN